MAVRPEPSIPCVTISAAEEAKNPDAPFLIKKSQSSSLYLSLIHHHIIWLPVPGSDTFFAAVLILKAWWTDKTGGCSHCIPVTG